MTTPVTASVYVYVLKMLGNLGGKSDSSELPILLIESRAVLKKDVAGILELFFFPLHKRNATIHPYEFCWLFDSWVCLFLL